jgi:hypothetical protein
MTSNDISWNICFYLLLRLGYCIRDDFVVLYLAVELAQE